MTPADAMSRPVIVVAVSTPVLSLRSPVSSTLKTSTPDCDPSEFPPSTTRAACMPSTVPPLLGQVVSAAPTAAWLPTLMKSSPVPALMSWRTVMLRTAIRSPPPRALIVTCSMPPWSIVTRSAAAPGAV